MSLSRGVERKYERFKFSQELWKEFCEQSAGAVSPDEPFQVWHFGDSAELADELYELVLQGKKTATASLAWENQANAKTAPKLNGFSVVTNFESNPRCVVKTTEIRTIPFNKVDEQFAFDEGEGDQSLDFWRAAHWDYFSRKCTAVRENPNTKMLVICERLSWFIQGKALKKILTFK